MFKIYLELNAEYKILKVVSTWTWDAYWIGYVLSSAFWTSSYIMRYKYAWGAKIENKILITLLTREF